MYLFVVLSVITNLRLTVKATVDGYERPNKQPNIVFILGDDLGYADFGFTGVASSVRTPNLDEIAKEGIILRQHYSQSVCTPTRGAILTGRYPIHTGLQHWVIKPGAPWGLPLDEITLPQILKEYNYSTHMVGKWHLGFHKWAYTPVFRGFDDFLGTFQGAGDYFNHYRDGGFDLRYDHWSEDGEFEEELKWDLDGMYNTEYYSQRVIDIIRNHDKSRSQPFFIYLSYQSAHNPHQVAQHYIDKYSSHFRYEDEQVFAGMVSAMDEGIGNITAAIRGYGLEEDTIVIFASDNGGAVNNNQQVNTSSSNYPFRGGKRSMYEGGIRTPAFVWAPNRIIPGGQSNAMIHVTDWLPTIWSLASLQGQLKPNNPIQTKTLDGFDQWDVILGRKPLKREEILINIDPLSGLLQNSPQSALRWRDWKLIIGGGGPPFGWIPMPVPTVSLDTDLPQDESILQFDLSQLCGNEIGDEICHKDYTELYNIKHDPTETWNVYRQYPRVVEFLRRKLAQYDETSVPPRYVRVDPASNPKYFNNTWMPWQDKSAVKHENIVRVGVEEEIQDFEE